MYGRRKSAVRPDHRVVADEDVAVINKRAVEVHDNALSEVDVPQTAVSRDRRDDVEFLAVCSDDFLQDAFALLESRLVLVRAVELVQPPREVVLIGDELFVHAVVHLARVEHSVVFVVGVSIHVFLPAVAF